MGRLVRGLALGALVLLSLAGGTGRAARAMVAMEGSTMTTQVLDISFISPTTGWRMTQRWDQNAGARGHPSLSETTDGGLRWHVRSSLPGFSIPQMLFADARNGWLYDSRLYATHDAGRTWHRITLHGTETTLSLSRGSIWRLDSSCSTSSDPRCHFTLLRSVTGSDVWHLMPRLPVFPRQGSSIARAGPNVAWVVGGPTPNVDVSRLTLAATTNGGWTWSLRPMPCNHAGFSALSVDLVAYTATDLWLFCASQPGAGLQAKAVFRSTDGGRTWRLVSRSSTLGTASRTVGTLTVGGYVSNAAVTSARGAWLALFRDTLIHTSDGGRTWRPAIPINVADPGGSGVGPIQFVDARHGWLLSFPTLLFRTVNGGRSWQKVP